MGEMGRLGNVLGRKMGETAMPKSSPRVKSEITVPTKIFKDSCPAPQTDNDTQNHPYP